MTNPNSTPPPTPGPIDRAEWNKAVTEFQRATENLSGWGWDYEARRNANARHEAARKALNALVEPFLSAEEA